MDSEGQNSGRSMKEELFLGVDEDDAGGLPHQHEANVGLVEEGDVLPPRPDGEPRSLPHRIPTL